MTGLLHSFLRATGLAARRCPACGAVIHTPDTPVCPPCSEAIQLRTGGFCPGCGYMSGRDDTPPTRCPECRRTPPPWDRLHFYGRYSGPLRDLILGYKFKGNFGRTKLLSDMAYRALPPEISRLPDLIIPVPLHRKRLLWRGFNQSTEISRIIGKRLDKPVLHKGLTRIRNTPPQTRLGREERQTNIKGAFRAAPKQIRGKAILLVDDVYTTGATLRECARTLKRAGASRVDALVLARAQQEPS